MRGFFMVVTLTLGLAGPAAAAGMGELEAAVRAGDAAAVAAALARGAPADAALADGMLTPLALAAARGDTAVLRALLNGGADADAAGALGLTPLAVAAQSCRAGPAVTAILLASGADPDRDVPGGMTPYLIAMQKGRADIAALLAAAGADGDAVDGFGDGALNYAIYARDNALVRRALDAGAGTGQLRQLYLGRGWRTAEWPGPLRCSAPG